MEQAELDDLIDRAATCGVALEVELHEDWAWLGHIERTTASRGAGLLVLEQLLEMADDADIPVRAAVEADLDRLVEWYRDLAFEIETTPDDPDGDGVHLVMIRHPQHPLARAHSSRS